MLKLNNNDFLKLCMSGTPDEVREAIRSGSIDVNAKGIFEAKIYNDGMQTEVFEATPLMAACLGENIETIRLLIEAGANVKARTEIRGLEMDVLCLASAFLRNPNVAYALIDAGADVNARCDNNMTAIMSVLGLNNNHEAVSSLVDIFINAGADVNAKTIHCVTVLMIAAGSEENPEIIRKLIRAGADVNAKDGNGKTALVYALEGNPNPEIGSVLRDAGASSFGALSFRLPHE